VVNDLQVFAQASLHHRACRAPGWNEGFIIRASGSALLSWRTVMLLLPFEAGGRMVRVAGLLVNPGLEEVWLAQDDGRWHPQLEESFMRAGLTPPTEGMPIQRPATGVTGHVSQTSLHADINGRTESYGSEAEPEIRAAAAQLGGFLLIVTSAADPAQIDPPSLMNALASPMTLVGWAKLEPPA
jgi:hypothetical protein